MQNKKNNETGKTFMEIIRIIIIVSVIALLLFVVGKWFFRVLFEDSVVDSTIKEVSSRAITASTRFMQGNENLVGSEFKERTEKGYPVLTYKIDENFFEITLLGVPNTVCRRIAEKRWSLPTSLYINGNLISSSNHFCSQINLVSFEFSRDLNSSIPDSEKPMKKHCQTDNDCSACEACRNNLCKTGCNAGEGCATNLKGDGICCLESHIAGSLCCLYIEDGQCCWGRDKCCPKDKPIRLEDGTCTNCFDSKPFSVGGEASLELCQTLCPNRIAFGDGNLCMLPICEQDQFMSRDGDCVNCQKEGGFATSLQECSKCPNRIYENGMCFLPCPVGTVKDIQGRCMSCDSIEYIFLEDDSLCTSTCSNRIMKQKGCALTPCPEGMIADQNGNCVSCNEKKGILLFSEEDCLNCPNREILGDVCVMGCSEGYFRTISGECISCQDKEAYPVMPASGECMKCPNRLGLENYCFPECKSGEFRDAYGGCRSCMSLQSYRVQQTAVCSICSYRSILLKYDQQGDQAYCKLQQCPMDYFADNNGSCYDCFLNEKIKNTTFEECEKCPNRMWSPENETCLIRPTCPMGTFMDTYGQCHACDDENPLVSVRGHLAECEKCSKRYVYGNWCRQCPLEKGILNTKDACQKCGGVWDNRIQKCM